MRTKRYLLIAHRANRNWILGNWIREIQMRNPDEMKIVWTTSVFAKKHWWEKLVKFPLKKCDGYFFTYPSIFFSYLQSNPVKFANKSIVNYTHNMNELGDLQHQAEVLNNAFSVHFMCKSDAENLVKHGLNATKVRIVYGAIDSECIRDLDIKRSPKTILLASVYSQRKGVEILPQIIARLPEWKFIILGRGWSDFLKESRINDCPNVDYRYFSKETRNIAMSEASVFLSLSKLEGGPIPLIESMSMDIYPVATDTGFASDLITQGVDGFVLENPPAIEEVCEAIVATEGLVSKPSAAVSHLNWDRIAEIVVTDFRCISTSRFANK